MSFNLFLEVHNNKKHIMCTSNKTFELLFLVSLNFCNIISFAISQRHIKTFQSKMCMTFKFPNLLQPEDRDMCVGDPKLSMQPFQVRATCIWPV